MPPSETVAGNLIELKPVWLIDRNGSDQFTDPLITADPAVMAAADPSVTRPSIYYLPKEKRVGFVQPVAGTAPIYRGNGGMHYTTQLDDYGFTLEEELGRSWIDAIDDSVKEIWSPGKRISRPWIGRFVRSTHDRFLGWGYRLGNREKFMEDLVVSVAGPTQTHTIKFDLRAGATITDWRVQMAVPAVDMQIVMRRAGYGNSFQWAVLFGEEFLAPGVQIYNPTQMGSGYALLETDTTPAPAGYKVPDWMTQASPVLSASSRSMPDGSTRVETRVVPLEFTPEGFLVPFGGLGDPAARTRPFTFHGAWLTSIYDFNWRGIEGVHRAEFRYFAPHDLPFAPDPPPPGIIIWEQGFLIDIRAVADKFYVFDAGNNVSTEAREGIEASAFDDSDYPDQFQLTLDTWEKLAGVHPARGPFLPHPLTSGVGGLIIRDTGTARGAGTDFSFGQYASWEKPLSSRALKGLGHVKASYNATYTQDFGVPDPDGKDGVNDILMDLRTQRFGGIARGYQSIVQYLVTGTFPQVTAKMRQLYLDGVR